MVPLQQDVEELFPSLQSIEGLVPWGKVYGWNYPTRRGEVPNDVIERIRMVLALPRLTTHTFRHLRCTILKRCGLAATARYTAAVRVRESERSDALFSDPWALPQQAPSPVTLQVDGQYRETESLE
jgi:hypothetical protein